jgi:hypothetical protein
MLGINLLSTDPRLLLLLIGLLLLGEEPNTWLQCSGPYRDLRDGYGCLRVLRRCGGGDGDNRGHHIAPSGAMGSRASPFTQGRANFVRGLLEDGEQRW